MNYIERRIEELKQYKPDLTAKDDLDKFWDYTLKEFRQRPFADERRAVSTVMDQVHAYDVSFNGFDNTRVHAWYLVPTNRDRIELPAVVLFHGYAGSANVPENHTRWLQAGFAVLAVDIRGQLGRTGNKLTSDRGQVKGYVTQNILEKERCYFLATFVDALRAIDWLADQPEVNASRIVVTGASQGGACH